MFDIKKIAPLIFAFFPVAVSAQTTLGGMVSVVGQILTAIVPVLVAVAMAVFIWGVIRYVSAGDSEEGRTKARNTIVWGIVALFAIVAVWGLVTVIGNTFNVTIGGGITAPGVPQ